MSRFPSEGLDRRYADRRYADSRYVNGMDDIGHLVLEQTYNIIPGES